jgi:hypothetical protein
MKVRIFQGQGKWYGFTDKDEAALPSDRGPWEMINTVDMVRGEPPRIGVSTDKVLDAVEAGEVYLTEAEIKVEVQRMGPGNP